MFHASYLGACCCGAQWGVSIGPSQGQHTELSDSERDPQAASVLLAGVEDGEHMEKR